MIEIDGFIYNPTTPVGKDPTAGTGTLTGPDGSQAELAWQLSEDGPYIMRLASPGSQDWGAYRLGFTQPVRRLADLETNLQALMPKLRILYSRIRVH